MRQPDLDDLFTEKSLWAVYWRSTSFPTAKLDVWLFRGYTAFGLTYLLAVIAYGAENPLVLDTISRLCNAMVTVSAAILGFLIAGFTIVVTVISKENFKALARTPVPQVGLSYAQSIFFAYLNTFSVFLVALFVAVFFYAIVPIHASPKIVSIDQAYYPVLNALILICLGAIYVSALLRLKGFIWNLYQTILIYLTI